MNGEPHVVQRLFFGRDDAENDLADGLLREGFVSTSAYEAALTGLKMLIIGRKGSGKSAICRRLASDDGYPGATTLITPDDICWAGRCGTPTRARAECRVPGAGWRAARRAGPATMGG